MAEERLTIQQQAVVDDRGGTLLVSAAAGSGKTKVLVDRVMEKIISEERNINEFLIITFTNAAAAELRVKISRAIAKALALRPDSRHLARQQSLLPLSQISTVHAFCGTLIRQYGYWLEITPDYRMLEDAERQELLDRQMEDLLEEAYEAGEPGFLLLADTLGAGRTDRNLSELALALYERALSQPSPRGWLRGMRFTLDGDADLSDTPWGIILREDAKRRLGSLIRRYDWAIGEMRGDAPLEKSYLPGFETVRAALAGMLAAMDGPWDQIAGVLTLPKISPRVSRYEDQDHLDLIKAVRKGDSLVEELQAIFGRPAAELRAEQNALAPALEALVDLTERLDRRFSAEKRRKNVMDFADQEQLAIRLLTHPETGRPTEIAREVSERFAEIMVDEYQDSNRVQETIFTAIARGQDENRFLVGDVKQSIYGFRQAEPEMFIEKYSRFRPAAEAAEGEPRRLVLSRNFRSGPGILEAVNHTFRTVMSESVGDIAYDAEQELYPGLEEYPALGGPAVELHVLELQQLPEGSDETGYQREAQWAAGRIAALLREGAPVREDGGTRPVRPGDVAVLVRTNDLISVFSRALRQAGIPVASGRGEDLFETQEVKVLVDLLRVLSNPHQDVPLLAVLCSPLFRFSNEQLAAIRAGSRSARFYDAMRTCQEPWCLRALQRLEDLRRQAGTMSADALVWYLLHGTGLLTAYSAMEGGQARRDNLLAVYNIAREGAAGGYLYLYQLLRLLDRAAGAGKTAASQSTEGVVVTSMHQSKGLEYPVVLLPGLSREFSKKEFQANTLMDPALGIGARITDQDLRVTYPGVCYAAIRAKKKRAAMSEEMRILYVAMTRARDRLVLSCAWRESGVGKFPEEARLRLLLGAGVPAAAWAVEEAGSMAEWVLLAAMNRVEAGELFQYFGTPAGARVVSDHPWEIRLHTVGEAEPVRYAGKQEDQAASPGPVPSPEQLRARLSWQDRHHNATVTPSKLTATQLKGRAKDEEAAEGSGVSAALPQLHRPEFVLEQRGLSPTEKGTAVHLFLQYARFDQCLRPEDIEGEKLRLEDEAFMTAEQLAAVEPEMILTLFRSELGRRLLRSEHLVREFKFSLLQDASDYFPGVEGEQVLLQGVVDAALVEEDGILVVDFKTDRVTDKTVLDRAEYYRGQLTAYKRALERIFDRPVKEMCLYFLTLGREVKL